MPPGALLPTPGTGQSHRESRPGAFFALERDAAAVQIDRLLDDRQPQPGAGRAAHIVGSVKRLSLIHI